MILGSFFRVKKELFIYGKNNTFILSKSKVTPGVLLRLPRNRRVNADNNELKTQNASNSSQLNS